MSKKDKRMFFLLVVLTSVLLSLILNDIYFRYKYKCYIYGAYKNSVEAVEVLEQIDSTFFNN